MSILNLDTASSPLYTNTSVAATGATTLVAAPGAGYSLAIQHLRVYLMTNTTQNVESEFNGAPGMFYSQGNSQGTSPLDVNLTASPWLMATNTALTFACTLGANSTPSIRVQVLYQVVKR